MRTAFVLLFVAATALAQSPRIDAISPPQGPIAGGFVVSVKGANLAGATVKVDTASITPLSQTDGEIRLQLPPHDNGYVVISARNASGSAYGEFLYLPPKLSDLPPGYVTTIAGIGSFVRDYGPALQATITPAGLAFDTNGNLYVAENRNQKISRIRTDGTIERVTADGQISFPLAVAVDPSGNVYIPDHFAYIRKVDAQTGIITAIAGDGTSGFSGDGGPASAAKITLPTHIAADANDLFFVDYEAHRIRRIHFADMTISTFAGNGTAGFSGDDGLAVQAQFDLGDSDQGHLAIDPSGNVFLADSANFRIRKINRQTNVITTFYVLPKPPSNAHDAVNQVRSLAVDAAGNVYYAGSGRIVKLDPNGQFVTSWGNGTYGLPVEGAPAATSGLGHITGLAIDASGNIVFSDDAISRIRKIDVAPGTLTSVAGIGPAIVGENGPALATTLVPNDLAFDPQGRLVIAETLRLRRLEASGDLKTIGGTGSFIGIPPPAPMANVTIAPVGIEIDRDGNIDMADLSVVDRVDAAGTLRWIVGHDSSCGLSGDNGPAAQAQICQAFDVKRDRDGNLLIADTNNNRIRRVDGRTGIITTIAGNGGPVNGFEGYGNGISCGDGKPAIDACLQTPYGIELDDAGNLFIAGEREIRKVDANGIITTFVPNQHANKLAFFHGYLYVGAYPSQIVRYDSNANPTVIAGTLDFGHSGDGGPALGAQLSVGHQASGIAIDAEGNVFFCSGAPTGNRVRAVRYGAVLAPLNATVRAAANGPSVMATVFDATGHPAPSVRVDFSVPASGASCVLATPFAITDSNGVAAVTCTPNCIAGSYAVTATPLSSGVTANVTMANSGHCHTRAAKH